MAIAAAPRIMKESDSMTITLPESRVRRQYHIIGPMTTSGGDLVLVVSLAYRGRAYAVRLQWRRGARPGCIDVDIEPESAPLIYLAVDDHTHVIMYCVAWALLGEYHIDRGYHVLRAQAWYEATRHVLRWRRAYLAALAEDNA